VKEEHWIIVTIHVWAYHPAGASSERIGWHVPPERPSVGGIVKNTSSLDFKMNMV
jgi:hypothetical protein